MFHKAYIAELQMLTILIVLCTDTNMFATAAYHEKYVCSILAYKELEKEEKEKPSNHPNTQMDKQHNQHKCRSHSTEYRGCKRA